MGADVVVGGALVLLVVDSRGGRRSMPPPPPPNDADLRRPVVTRLLLLLLLLLFRLLLFPNHGLDGFRDDKESDFVADLARFEVDGRFLCTLDNEEVDGRDRLKDCKRLATVDVCSDGIDERCRKFVAFRFFCCEATIDGGSSGSISSNWTTKRSFAAGRNRR